MVENPAGGGLQHSPPAAREAVAQQLSELLGREIKEIRTTKERPPRISVVDVAALVTGKDSRKAAQDLVILRGRFPDVAQNFALYKFPGKRQRDTPVCGARALVELVMLLPGKPAARVRRQAAELLCRRGGRREG